MPCPIVIEFDWKAVLGNDTHTGRGLLSKGLHPFRTKLDEFTVAVGDLIVSAFPKAGEIKVDFQRSHLCDCGKEHKLVWFRTMKIDRGNEASNSTAECLLYALGLECERGKIGWTILPDGTVRRGID